MLGVIAHRRAISPRWARRGVRHYRPPAPIPRPRALEGIAGAEHDDEAVPGTVERDRLMMQSRQVRPSRDASLLGARLGGQTRRDAGEDRKAEGQPVVKALHSETVVVGTGRPSFTPTRGSSEHRDALSLAHATRDGLRMEAVELRAGGASQRGLRERTPSLGMQKT